MEQTLNQSERPLTLKETLILKNQYESKYQTEICLIENQPDFCSSEQSEINNLVKKNLKELYYNQMINNICQDKEPRYYKKVCRECKKDFETDENGSALIYQYFCQNSFCKNLPCFKYRFMVYKKLFTGFFNFYKAWRIKRNSKWVHFALGIKRQSQPTKEELNNFNRRVNSFIKDYNEKFSILRGTYIKDFTYDVKRKGEEWYVHYHFAVRPMKKELFEEIQNLAEEHSLHYSYFGFKKTKWLINYFAKRCAGSFGHKAQGDKLATDFMFADIINSKTYFNLFHRSRKNWFIGLKEGEVKRLRTCLEEILHECEALVLSSKALPTERRLNCEYCGSKLFLKQEIKPEGNIPPPNEITKQKSPEFQAVKIAETPEKKEFNKHIEQKNKENKKINQRKKICKIFK